MDIYKYTFDCKRCGEFTSNGHMRECPVCNKPVRQIACETVWFRLGYSLPDNKVERFAGMVEMVYGKEVNVTTGDSIHTSGRKDIYIQPIDGQVHGFKRGTVFAKVHGFVHGCLLMHSYE